MTRLVRYSGDSPKATVYIAKYLIYFSNFVGKMMFVKMYFFLQLLHAPEGASYPHKDRLLIFSISFQCW
jgi:hypothetical protein